MQRRLTTIVAADVAGYSHLIGLDEEGTLAALNAQLIAKPACSRRVVETALSLAAALPQAKAS